MRPTLSVRAEVVKEPLFRAIGFGLKAGVDVVTPEGRPDIDSVIELAWYPFWLVAVTVKDSPFPVFIPTVLGEIARENPMILSDIETDLISPELFPHTVSVYVPVVVVLVVDMVAVDIAVPPADKVGFGWLKDTVTPEGAE